MIRAGFSRFRTERPDVNAVVLAASAYATSRRMEQRANEVANKYAQLAAQEAAYWIHTAVRTGGSCVAFCAHWHLADCARK